MVPLPFVQYPKCSSWSLNLFLSVQLCVKEAVHCSVWLTFDVLPLKHKVQLLYRLTGVHKASPLHWCKKDQLPIWSPSLPYVPGEQRPCPFSKSSLFSAMIVLLALQPQVNQQTRAMVDSPPIIRKWGVAFRQLSLPGTWCSCPFQWATF